MLSTSRMRLTFPLQSHAFPHPPRIRKSVTKGNGDLLMSKNCAKCAPNSKNFEITGKKKKEAIAKAKGPARGSEIAQ